MGTTSTSRPASAPWLLALLWNHIPRIWTVAKAWNIAGLLLLAQVALTGILSAPGPQQLLNRDEPNLAVVTFPYVLVAALFVVSALALHILALRKLALQQVGSAGSDPDRDGRRHGASGRVQVEIVIPAQELDEERPGSRQALGGQGEPCGFPPPSAGSGFRPRFHRRHCRPAGKPWRPSRG